MYGYWAVRLRVKIRVYMDLVTKLGWKENDIVVHGESSTLREVLERIQELRSFLNGEFTERFIVLINGVNSRFSGGLLARVKDGDVVDIFPPAGGG
ncbi:MAG: MoaD/ThiS family protein [Sulfolobales archaeon]